MKNLFILLSAFLICCFVSCSKEADENLLNSSGEPNETTIQQIELKSGFIVQKRGNEYSMGDILLSETQVKLLDETGSIFPETIDLPTDSIIVSTSSGMRAYYSGNAATRAIGRHPNENAIWSMVRYVVDPSLSADQHDTLRLAIQHIEANTNVRFYNATGQPTVDPTYGFNYPYVNIMNNPNSYTVSNSYVGRIGGRQDLKIGGFPPFGIVVHELCHACAMYHEHCRPDRDNYITVYTNNVDPEALNDVRKITTNYYTRGSFDFNSIMIYGSYTFSKNGNPTMLKKNGDEFYQQYTLSSSDRAWLNYFYLPYIARSDVYAELDDVVYDGNNNILTAQQRLQLQALLNNGNPYPPAGGRIPNVH